MQIENIIAVTNCGSGHCPQRLASVVLVHEVFVLVHGVFVLVQGVFVLVHRVFVLVHGVFVLVHGVFVLVQGVLGLRSSFLALRFSNTPSERKQRNATFLVGIEGRRWSPGRATAEVKETLSHVSVLWRHNMGQVDFERSLFCPKICERQCIQDGNLNAGSVANIRIFTLKKSPRIFGNLFSG